MISVIPDRDESGRSIVRTAATVKGWHYQALSVEFQTGTGTVFCKDAFGNDLSNLFDVRRYDVNNVITNSAMNTVKSVLTFKIDIDFEIISGSLRQTSLSNSDLRVWVTGGMFNELNNYEPISVKEFVTGGLNLALVEDVITDGRASKFMKHITEGAPFPTNRFQYTFTHDAGFQKAVLITMEIFKQ